jgi:isocitrate lyase
VGNGLGGVATALGLRKKLVKIGAQTLESEDAFAALVEARG